MATPPSSPSTSEIHKTDWNLEKPKKTQTQIPLSVAWQNIENNAKKTSKKISEKNVTTKFSTKYPGYIDDTLATELLEKLDILESPGRKTKQVKRRDSSNSSTTIRKDSPTLENEQKKESPTLEKKQKGKGSSTLDENKSERKESSPLESPKKHPSEPKPWDSKIYKLAKSSPILLIKDTDPENFELISGAVQQQTSINPGLSSEQLTNVRQFEKDADVFASFIKSVYSKKGVPNLGDIENFEEAYQDMLAAANTILFVAKETTLFGNRKNQWIDFFVNVKDAFRRANSNSFFEKIQRFLDPISNELKNYLILDVKNMRYSSVRHLVNLDKKDACFSVTRTKIEKLSNEIKILEYYKKTLYNLVFYFRDVDKNVVFFKNQKIENDLFKKVDDEISKILTFFKKNDKDQNEIKALFPDSVHHESDLRLFIFQSLSNLIETRLINIFYINTYKEKIEDIIKLYCQNLKDKGQRYQFFYEECINEFETSLASQKYDDQFLLWQRRMAGGGAVCYYDEEHNFLLRPKKIVEPTDETNTEEMTRYQTELHEYFSQSTNLLSFYAFEDKTFLENLFKTAAHFCDSIPDLPEAHDTLSRQAKLFQFLFLLQTCPQYYPILSDLNESISYTNIRATERLVRRIEDGPPEKRDLMPVQLAIDFLLRFYRSIGDRYINVPIGNIIQISQITHPSFGNLIKRGSHHDEDKLMQVKKRIYITLGPTSYAIRSVCMQDLDLGPDIHETHCNIFTDTHICEPYPGQWATYQKSIEFFYKRVKPDEQSKEIELRINEKLDRLKILVETLGFPIKERVDTIKERVEVITFDQ